MCTCVYVGGGWGAFLHIQGSFQLGLFVVHALKVQYERSHTARGKSSWVDLLAAR